jgi:hypothetical protein
VKKIAVEFVRYVLERNPEADSFAKIYDAMSRTASSRAFHNLGYQELASAGISFSLTGYQTVRKYYHRSTGVKDVSTQTLRTF